MWQDLLDLLETLAVTLVLALLIVINSYDCRVTLDKVELEEHQDRLDLPYVTINSIITM